jgi:hypothetical protein
MSEKVFLIFFFFFFFFFFFSLSVFAERWNSSVEKRFSSIRRKRPSLAWRGRTTRKRRIDLRLAPLSKTTQSKKQRQTDAKAKKPKQEREKREKRNEKEEEKKKKKKKNSHVVFCGSVVTVLDLVEPDFQVVGSFEHPYPPTKVAFGPEKARNDLLATSGDYLRLWQIRGNEVLPKVTLNQNKSSEFCAPLTSFDWNESVPSMIGTCSIDTTCEQRVQREK